MIPPLFDDEPNAELSRGLAEVKARVGHYLRREFARVDDYFEHYEHKLRARKDREHRENSVERYQQRIETTHAEHQRRSVDQIERQAMRRIPHLRALAVIAEPAFRAVVEWRTGREAKSAGALLPARARRWSFATEG
jgi:hypothetical protein